MFAFKINKINAPFINAVLGEELELPPGGYVIFPTGREKRRPPEFCSKAKFDRLYRLAKTPPAFFGRVKGTKDHVLALNGETVTLAVALGLSGGLGEVIQFGDDTITYVSKNDVEIASNSPVLLKIARQ